MIMKHSKGGVYLVAQDSPHQSGAACTHQWHSQPGGGQRSPISENAVAFSI